MNHIQKTFRVSALWLVGSLVGFSGCSTVPRRQTPSLTGTWVGDYAYDGKHQITHVSFQATLTRVGNHLDGMISEPNTFDDKGETKQLTATIFEGVVEGTQVRFRKQYNGAGGYSHSVMYSGTLDPERATITGQWSIKELVGAFTMKLQR